MHLCRSITVAIGIWMVICTGNSLAVEKGSAKDLFVEQLSKPTEKLNTGLTYWIELNRQGKVKRVNSTLAFKSGDKIRIHAVPNIDGYAYMVMLQGSTGKQAVLFPAPGLGQNNRVIHGKTYLIPTSGDLMFDSHPGKETVRLALSRQVVDAQALLKNGSTTGDITQVAKAPKRQAPIQIAQATPQQPTVPPPKNYLVSVDDPTTAPLGQELQDISQQEQNLGMAKDLFFESSPALAAKHGTGKAHPPAPKHRVVRRTAAITVVNALPTGELYADIVLNHE